MMYYTHLAFGLLVSLLAINLLDINNKLFFILIVLLFSIFPDIDEKRSKIGRKYKKSSAIINFIFGHRGFFHTIFIPLILYSIFYYINNEIGVAVLIGYSSHLFMDAITRAGIKPLSPIISKKNKWPNKNKFIYGKNTFFDNYHPNSVYITNISLKIYIK